MDHINGIPEGYRLGKVIETYSSHRDGRSPDQILFELIPIEQPKRLYSVDAELLAKAFHESYEGLAPSFGYETRKASAKPWDDVPENNRRLMIAVCAEILSGVTIRNSKQLEAAEFDLIVKALQNANDFSPCPLYEDALKTAITIREREKGAK